MSYNIRHFFVEVQKSDSIVEFETYSNFPDSNDFRLPGN